ncbi:hypothetical protein EDB81DRAFT_795400 [Dactylonectria macrodidyma]|uniref:Uncharacterized protein n=1 Tax=Dactylonectria macrodidyma TaxID=307937 RepID=A0A9P9EWD1_9HYPO|nr:hypothetical protein EDB81DRAFT_795400 [Dactylonectria macrodidyma]
MSATSTTTRPHLDVGNRNHTLQETLQDYQIHLTGSSIEAELGALPESTPTHNNPAHWPTQYRRIPAYRPINRNLDLSERPNGANRAELLFVTVMLNGVRLQSGLVRAWECTGGHWYPQLTRYKIGGEW